MRVIAFANQKGGVAKTTSTLNIGAGLALAGKRVLLIDLDPQGNLTESSGFDPVNIELSLHDVLVGAVELAEVVVGINQNLDLAPANDDMLGTELDLIALKGEQQNLMLRRAIKELRGGYDYVLLDCPPSLGKLTVNALNAASEVFVPLQCEYLALRGLKKLMQTIDGVKAYSNGRLMMTGVFGTRFSERKKLNYGVVEQLQVHLGSTFFSTKIRENIALAEAAAAGKNIFEYRHTCNGAIDYLSLCQEIIRMEKK
jgi:chromosome partitioning protein